MTRERWEADLEEPLPGWRDWNNDRRVKNEMDQFRALMQAT